MRPALPLCLALLASLACQGGAPRDEASIPQDGAAGGYDRAAERPEALGSAAAAPAPTAPPAAAPDAVLSLSGSGGAQFSAETGMVIRTGTASLRVDSLEPALAAVRALAARAGGHVGNTVLQAGDESVRSATLELRIPAERFDEVVAGLSPVGAVEWVNVQAEDVGEQYVDLAARAANAERLEARLVELLAARTGKLSDVLAVERELARVREEIERIEGRMRYLRTRAATSTLSVTVHEPGPLVGQPGDRPIADAFREAWRNAVAVVAWLIAAAGVLVPLAVLAGGAAWAARRMGLRRRPAPAEAA